MAGGAASGVSGRRREVSGEKAGQAVTADKAVAGRRKLAAQDATMVMS